VRSPVTDHAEGTVSGLPGREPRRGEVWQRLPEPGETLGGRFHLGRVLGAGGSGVVFEAQDLQLNQRVAVKILHPHLAEARTLERLRREVRAARDHHPHAVAVYDLHEAEGLRFLSMELVAGDSLKTVLQRRGRLTVVETIALGQQLSSALASLHERGLVHRDVKPGNILLAGAGEHGDGRRWVAKLCDLGLVRSLESGITVTETAMVVGTPAYMAPEQATGEELTPASDIYALGLVLWECLTGDTPLRGESTVATLIRRQTGRPPRLRSLRPDAPPWLARLLEAMLDPDPRFRPGAREVERALLSGRVRWRVPWRRLAAAAALLLAAAVGVFAWRAVARGATVRMEAVGRTVAGYDERGRTTWRYELDNPVQQVERADVDGDGNEELLVSAFPPKSQEEAAYQLLLSEFLITSRAGRLFTRVRPEELVRSWDHPFPLRLAPAIKLLDVDGDSLPEVLLNARQRWFFPDQVLLYWPRQGSWDWAVDHSGYLVDLAAVPGQPGHVAVVGLNNRLGMTPIFGIFRTALPAARDGTTGGDTVLASPDRGLELHDMARWEVYSLLPPDIWTRSSEGTPRLLAAPDGTFEVAIGSQSLHIDAFGNPAGSPNWGRDLRGLRREFLAREVRLRGGYPVGTADSLPETIAALHRSMQPLLAEAPYRVLAALAAARAWARLGQRQQAMAALAPELGSEEVAFRLAHLEALEGHFTRAARRAQRLITEGQLARASFDAQRLLLDITVEAGDRAGLEQAVAACGRLVVGVIDEQPGLVSTLWARARLWWDELTLADAQVRSWPLADDGAAVACLARWRLGQGSAADVVAMQDYIRGGFEGTPLGRVALAASLLTNDQSSAALSELDRVILELTEEAQVDLRARQHLHLARALHAHALAALGRRQDARAEAERLLAESRPGLLPATLARELEEELK